MIPRELFELFSIDRTEKGALMFTVLVGDLEDGMDAPHALSHICGIAHMPRPAVYSCMKRTLAPVFDAEPETLRKLGIEPQNTTVGLARALLRTMKGGGTDGA